MYKNKLYITLSLCISVFLLTGCFTGVEGTKKITDKDVKKLVEATSQEEIEANSLAIPVDSFANWKVGKRIYACDNNVALIFAPSSEYNSDTLKLKGVTLRYIGYHLGSVLDNRKTVNMDFTDGKHKYVYSTDKTVDEIKSDYSIPFLIDMDEVNYVDEKLRGCKCYVKTSIWYDSQEQMIAGRKFVPVTIDSVLPGNKVFPIKVVFTDIEKSKQAMVWMTTGGTVMKNRSFDALFSYTDIRKRYPDIADDVWVCIVEGKVKNGMTKEEVRLSFGNPMRTNQRPTHEGIKEYWYYSDGKYLYFEDGVLMMR